MFFPRCKSAAAQIASDCAEAVQVICSVNTAWFFVLHSTQPFGLDVFRLAWWRKCTLDKFIKNSRKQKHLHKKYFGLLGRKLWQGISTTNIFFRLPWFHCVHVFSHYKNRYGKTLNNHMKAARHDIKMCSNPTAGALPALQQVDRVMYVCAIILFNLI